MKNSTITSHRFLTSVLAVSTLMNGAIGTASAATTYSTTSAVLQQLPGATSNFTINRVGPTGLLVGQSSANLTDNSPVVWNTLGQITNLSPGLTGSVLSFYATDLNSAGQILLDIDTPYLWTNGTLTPITLGIDGYVKAFNTAGQVVGTSTMNDGFISGDGVTTIIGPPPSVSATASVTAQDINENSQVILNTLTSDGSRSPALFWQNGVTQDLGTLPGDVQSYASAINDSAQIVGSSTLVQFQQSRAVIWENGVIRDLGAAAYGPVSVATAINNLGQIVGYAQTTSGSKTSLLWENNQITNLNPLLGQAASSCRPIGINDGGQIAVLCGSSSSYTYYRLNPVNTGTDVGVAITPLATSVTIDSPLTYTLTVTNAGASSVSGATLTDILPTGINFVSATPSQGSCNASTSVVCDLGSIGIGASAKIQIGVVPTVAGNLTNSASVTINETDTNPANDSAAITVSVVSPNADLGITMTDSPDPAKTLSNLTYSINVTNTGPGTASGVTVTDTLPSSMTYISTSSSQGSCSGTSTVTCNFGNLPTGTSARVTIVVQPRSTGTYTNTAAVRSSTPDPVSVNNSVTATTRVKK